MKPLSSSRFGCSSTSAPSGASAAHLICSSWRSSPPAIRTAAVGGRAHLTDNLTAYRRRYVPHCIRPRSSISCCSMKTTPRSVGYQLRRLQRNIGRLHRSVSSTYRNAEERLILEPHHLAACRYRSWPRSPRQHLPSTELSRLLDALHTPLSNLSGRPDPQPFQPCRSSPTTDHHVP